MKYLVLDLETSGPLPEKEGFDPLNVCELAACMWEPIKPLDRALAKVLGNRPFTGKSFQTFVKPPRPIAPATSAVHHILDEDVAGAPDLFEAVDAMEDALGWPADYLVAHKASFEAAHLSAAHESYALHVDDPETNHHYPRWICTWKCALELMPEQESHSNQALRYAMRQPGWNDPRMMPAHRALPDVWATGMLLEHLLTLADAATLANITASPVIPGDAINFGKHQGTKWVEMDLEYMALLIRSPKYCWEADKLATLEHWYEKRTGRMLRRQRPDEPRPVPVSVIPPLGRPGSNVMPFTPGSLKGLLHPERTP
jgi:exodeoxyribonuclease X